MDQSESDWRTRAADLFEHHEVVLKRLAAKNPAVDSADLHDAFVKALLDIAGEPSRFDQSRGTDIEDFLAGAAQRSLLQILRSDRRRVGREEKKAALVVNEAAAARAPDEVVANRELAEHARSVANSEDERNVLRLWELGHSDAEIADRLAMSQNQASRIRDRLTQRLRRLGKDAEL